ncbi:acyl carrier protein [Streptomyces sp. JJ36]|uniref:acyl carrier protein n=1 Tax=Streptomyces sp. JJ36 TaxID=2736645 RepID=UPI001F2C5BFC|nr:acyl carrier protein [Streptomyces sp. JJ36]MCF6521794.1 acyl carrier protein [Streptomyces sp. JJ36]
MTTEQSIINHIAKVLLDGDSDGLDSETPLTELNIIDSAGIFDLVHHLQSEFRVTVPLPEVSPENFATVSAMAALVDRLREDQGGAR